MKPSCLYYGDNFVNDKKLFLSNLEVRCATNWITGNEITETGEEEDSHVSLLFDTMQNTKASIVFLRLPESHLENDNQEFWGLLSYAKDEAKFSTIIVLVPRNLPNPSQSQIPICKFARKLKRWNETVIMLPDCEQSILAMQAIVKIVEARTELEIIFNYRDDKNKGITEYDILFDRENRLF